MTKFISERNNQNTESNLVTSMLTTLLEYNQHIKPQPEDEEEKIIKDIKKEEGQC